MSDSIAFDIQERTPLSFSSTEPQPVTLNDKLFIKGDKGDTGDTGLSAFQEWVLQTGNEDKTWDDYMTYIQGGTFTVSIEFEAAESITFTCPGAMQIDSIEMNNTATITITKDGETYTLGTELAKFDQILIMPSGVCFAILNCTTL